MKEEIPDNEELHKAPTELKLNSVGPRTLGMDVVGGRER